MPEYVTTTGIVRPTLDEIVHILRSHGWVYESNLTTRTSVLLVNNASKSTSCKLEEAKRHSNKISAVRSEWVTQAACSPALIEQYRIVLELFGAHICTTSLSAQQRQAVQTICSCEGANYETALTKQCRILVLADEGTSPQNEKMRFVERHPEIIKMSYTTFVTKYGVRCGACTESDFLRERSKSLIRQLNLRHVICYCTPPSAVTPAVRSLLCSLQVQRVPLITSNTTHVVVIGGCILESFVPRNGLSFVKVQWLQECLERQEEVPIDTFLIAPTVMPTITFASLVNTERKNVRNALVDHPQLRCVVQDVLVLGPTEDAAVRNTTHLVVPERAIPTSEKVRAVAERFQLTGRHECSLVSLRWVEECLRLSQWIDATDYLIPMSACCGTLPKPNLPPPETNPGVVPVEPTHINIPPSEKPSEGRPSFDSEILNQSLEALVGHLERRVSPKLPDTTTKPRGGDGSPHMKNSNAMWGAEEAHRFSASSILQASAVGQSFAAFCDKSPQNSKDLLIQCVSTESQTVVYQSKSVCEYSVPPPLLAPTAAGIVLGAQCASPAPRGVRPRYKLLIGKGARDDATICANVKAILSAEIVDRSDECTHFIITKPTKTESFLRCMAAGKWVLHPSFLTESLRRKQFVSEEEYEWGSPQMHDDSAPSAQLALAAGCRLQRQRGGGIFAGLRALLTCSDQTRGASFGRVLSSGGCESVACMTPAEVMVQFTATATCAQPDSSLLLLSDDSLWDESSLVHMEEHFGVHVYRMELLVHCLCTAQHEPNNASFLLLSHMQNRKRGREKSS